MLNPKLLMALLRSEAPCSFLCSSTAPSHSRSTEVSVERTSQRPALRHSCSLGSHAQVHEQSRNRGGFDALATALARRPPVSVSVRRPSVPAPKGFRHACKSSGTAGELGAGGRLLSGPGRPGDEVLQLRRRLRAVEAPPWVRLAPSREVRGGRTLVLDKMFPRSR